MHLPSVNLMWLPVLLADLTGEDRVYAGDNVGDEPNAMIIYTSGTTSLPKGEMTRGAARSTQPGGR